MKRGYKKTEIGEIPVEWEVDCLQNISDVKTGGTPSRDKLEYWNGTIPWMSSGEINRKIITHTDEFITELALKKSNAQFLPVDTIMIALNGQGKTRGTAAITKIPLTCNQSLAGIIFNKDLVSPSFAFFYFENNYQKLRHLTGDEVRNGLNMGIIRQLKIILPPLPEQKKIAEILSSVDEAIRATQAVVDQAKTLKQGMLSELLTKGIGHKKSKQTEIGEIPVEWEVSDFSSACDVIMDGTHFSPKSKAGPCPYITSKNIRDGYFDLSTIEYITEAEHNEIYKKCPVLLDDVLLTKDGANTGNCVVNTLDFMFSLLSSVAVLRVNRKILSNNFLYQYISSAKGQRMIKGSISGQAITRITLEKINNFLLPLPPLLEQKQIVKILSSVDDTIRENSNRIEQLKVLKSGLMQDLLTGAVRVKVPSA